MLKIQPALARLLSAREDKEDAMPRVIDLRHVMRRALYASVRGHRRCRAYRQPRRAKGARLLSAMSTRRYCRACQRRRHVAVEAAAATPTRYAIRCARAAIIYAHAPRVRTAPQCHARHERRCDERQLHICRKMSTQHIYERGRCCYAENIYVETRAPQCAACRCNSGI